MLEPTIMTATELAALADRLLARAGSVMLRDQPQQQADMRLAARVITTLMPVAAIGTELKLIELGAQLDRTWAEQRRLEGSDDFENARDRVSRIVDEIEALPAYTMGGLRVKARAIWWCHSGEASISFGELHPTTDLRLAQSIVVDLLRNAAKE
jgi:hypothetical protein